MIFELYTSAVSFFDKSDHKKFGFVSVLYLFMDISSLKSKKGEKNQKIIFCPHDSFYTPRLGLT